jgi:hypothetical protein
MHVWNFAFSVMINTCCYGGLCVISGWVDLSSARLVKSWVKQCCLLLQRRHILWPFYSQTFDSIGSIRRNYQNFFAFAFKILICWVRELQGRQPWFSHVNRSVQILKRVSCGLVFLVESLNAWVSRKEMWIWRELLWQIKKIRLQVGVVYDCRKHFVASLLVSWVIRRNPKLMALIRGFVIKVWRIIGI